MKKILVLGSLLLLTACTSFDISRTSEISKDVIRDLLTDDTENASEASNEGKTQETLSLTPENVSKVLASVKETIKANERIVFDGKAKKIAIYTGQYADIKDNAGIQNLKMTLSPRRANASLKKDGNSILFRSIYQGTYLISWEDFLGVTKQVQVENNLKYKFTQEENYAIISRNFQDKNLKATEEAVSLYQIAFPDGGFLRQSMLLLLKLSTEKADKKIAKDTLQYWSQLQGLSKEEQEQVSLAKQLLREVKAETKESGAGSEVMSIETGASYDTFKSLYQSGNRKATLLLYDGAIADYLAALAINQNFKETSRLYQGLGNAYYGIGKYQESVEYFQKSLDSQSSKEKSDKGAELYYKLASAYNKLGSKTEYKKYLTVLRSSYPNTLWGRKAYIELMKLN